MKINKILLIFFILILCSSFAYAAQPITLTYAGEKGYDITYPIIEHVNPGEKLTLNFHIFNSSGYPLTEGFSCSFHLYNEKGDHLFEAYDLNTFDHRYDIEVELQPRNFTEKGYYSYLFQCNNSDIGGFVKSEIFVGYENDGLVLIGSMIMIFIVSFVSIILGFLLKGAFETDRWNAGTIMLWFYSLICLFMGTNILVERVTTHTLSLTMIIYFMWSVLAITVIMFIYFVLMYTMDIWTKNIEEARRLE